TGAAPALLRARQRQADACVRITIAALARRIARGHRRTRRIPIEWRKIMIVPVILSGGAGTRLWPVSRSAYPKPFMRMGDGESLLYKTLDRALKLADGGQVLTVTGRDYYFLTRDEYAR